MIDRLLLPWHCIWNLLYLKLFHLGPKILRSSSVWNHGQLDCSMVLHLCSSCLFWQLLCLQEASTLRYKSSSFLGYRTSSENQPNSKRNPKSSVVHEPYLLYFDGRNPSFRSCVYRIVLHPFRHMGTANLLYLRIPIYRIYHLDPHMCRNYYRDVLLPALQ